MPKSTTNFITVPLSSPIMRGETKVAEIKLREPKSGEMRGISMVDLIQLKADTVHELLPRISDPVLTDDEVKDLSLADLFALSSEIADFLLPAAASPPSPPA